MRYSPFEKALHDELGKLLDTLTDNNFPWVSANWYGQCGASDPCPLIRTELYTELGPKEAYVRLETALVGSNWTIHDIELRGRDDRR